MSFTRLQHRLTLELTTPYSQKLFDAAKDKYPAFADYDSPMRVIYKLHKVAMHLWTEKAALVCALIDAHRTSDNPYWSSFLLLAFLPMLRRLSARIGTYPNRDELDQMIICAFFESIGELTQEEIADRACLRIRQKTMRRVYRLLKIESNYQQKVCLGRLNALLQASAEQLEEAPVQLEWPEYAPTEKEAPISEEEAEHLIWFLRNICEQQFNRDQLVTVVARYICNFKLIDLVRKDYPDLSEPEVKHIYQRIKRRHNRTMTKMRSFLKKRYASSTMPASSSF